MGKKRLYDTKAGYQRMIAEYIVRRNAVRNLFVVDGKYTWNKEHRVEYGKRVKKINHKITICKMAIARIEVYEQKLIEIDKLIYEFIGVKIRNNKSQTKLSKNARKVFYRHCLDTGILTRRICDYVGTNRIETPTSSRKAFIRSFATNSANKELWYRWKNYLKNLDK